MAKFKVVKAFKDATTLRSFSVGDEYPVDDAHFKSRVRELMADKVGDHVGPFVALVPDEGEIIQAVAENAPEAPEFDVNNATVAELREELDGRGIEYPAKATKAQLKALL